MILEKSSALEPIDLEKLRKILRSPGPCVTIILPHYHPGEPAQTMAALLKSNIQDARRAIAEQGFFKAGTDAMLEPLEQLAKDSASFTGSRWGRVIFCSPEVCSQFRLVQPVKPSLTVAGCFQVRRLLPELSTPRMFYMLALSKESVQLFRCTCRGAEAIALPAGVPATLEEALALDRPDHDLENRSAIDGTTGSMHAVRFGTGYGREANAAHLADFYKLVDRGLQTFIHEPAPILLAGVEEDIVSYRAINTYQGLSAKSLRGSPGLLFQQADTTILAALLLRTEELEHQGKALSDAKENVTRSRISTSLPAIVRAAFEGRVHELYFDENAEAREIYETPAYHTWGIEDLFNLAAVETLLHGGKACELPSNMMPRSAKAMAILRYCAA